MEVEGMSEFRAALRDKRERMAAATETAVGQAADVVAGITIAKLIAKQHPRGTQTPSAPGEPPAMITGDLARSVHTTPVFKIGDTYEAEVGPTEEYSRIQELGGVAGRGAVLPARPYLKPAVEEAKPEIERIFKEQWRQT